MPNNAITSVLRAGIPAILAELLATALLVLMGCMSCVPALTTAPTSLQISFGFGLVVMFLVQIFGHISGAHMNPSVTLAAVLWGSLPISLAIAYVAAQVLGGWIGFGLLRLFTPFEALYPNGSNVTGVCSTVPNDSISGLQAMLVEMAATSILILLCCSVWDPVNKHNTDGVPLKFGLTVTALAVVVGPYTGASMNPARSLAPAIWNEDWHHHWVYWVGPLLGSLVCTLLYRTLFLKREKSSASSRGEIPLSCEKPLTGVSS